MPLETVEQSLPAEIGASAPPRSGALGLLRTNLAELGVAGTVFYAIRRALDASGLGVTLVFYRLVAQEVPEAPLLSPRRGKKIATREAAKGDPALAGLPLTDDVIDARFAQGAHCLVAEKDGTTIGCVWLCLDGYDEDEVRARFVPDPPERTAWDFDVYIDPAQRGGIAFAKLWDATFAFLRASGRRWSISRISAFNPASIHGHGRLGARVVGRMVVLAGRRRQLSLATLPPFLHWSAGPGSAPRLRIKAPSHGRN